MNGSRVPAEAWAAVGVVEDALGSPPVAAFLSGSAVAGGLRPLSDVDVVVVVEDALDDAARHRLAAAFLRASGRYGGGGPVRPLDVALVRLGDVVPWRYPPVLAFAYGEWLRAAYEVGYVPAERPEPDLAIVLAQVRANGVPLRGPAAADLLDPVPEDDLRRALRDALPTLLGDLHGDERNVVLTLARMWRTAVTGAFAPKDAAATWAALRLPREQADLIERAGQAYTGASEGDGPERAAGLAALVERLRREVVDACGG
jgi:aminoglycoside 9-adenylyltransferase